MTAPRPEGTASSPRERSLMLCCLNRRSQLVALIELWLRDYSTGTPLSIHGTPGHRRYLVRSWRTYLLHRSGWTRLLHGAGANFQFFNVTCCQKRGGVASACQEMKSHLQAMSIPTDARTHAYLLCQSKGLNSIRRAL